MLSIASIEELALVERILAAVAVLNRRPSGYTSYPPRLSRRIGRLEVSRRFPSVTVIDLQSVYPVVRQPPIGVLPQASSGL